MDRDSFNEHLASLFSIHNARLYRFARRLSSDPEEAWDLVQETFLRAARQPSLLLSVASAEAWLFRILVNLCRDRYRKSKVRARARELLQAGIQESLDTESSALARATVQSALSRLSPRRRAVIVLHELEEVPVKEIARLLGITQATVRWHLAAGRRSLSEELLDRAANREPGGSET